MEWLDALLSTQSVLEMSSQAAMKLFRGQQLPFKASFRRFADDEFDSEEKEQPPFHQKDAVTAIEQATNPNKFGSPTAEQKENGSGKMTRKLVKREIR